MRKLLFATIFVLCVSRAEANDFEVFLLEKRLAPNNGRVQWYLAIEACSRLLMLRLFSPLSQKKFAPIYANRCIAR